jgi:hypothetical protein
MAQSKTQNISDKLGKLNQSLEQKKVTTAAPLQEIAQVKEVKKTGRKSHRVEGVEYVRISPAIPTDLKQEMDVAIKTNLRDSYPTIDTVVEAALRLFLKENKI